LHWLAFDLTLEEISEPARTLRMPDQNDATAFVEVG
jgi:hypothetical protein